MIAVEDVVTDIKRTLLSGAVVVGGLDIDVNAMLATEQQAEVDEALLTSRREDS